MKITLSRHCREEMIIRSIKEDDIIETINAPDRMYNRDAITIAWKRFGNDGLKVIYRIKDDCIFVITAYPKLSI